MKTKKLLMVIASAVLGVVSTQAATNVVMSEGFNVGFVASDFYTTNSTTFAAHFVTILSSPNNGLSGTEGDGYSVLNVNNPADSVLSLLGRGTVDLGTVTTVGATYTFTGDFAWRFPSAAGTQDDLYMGSGSGFRINGAIQPASQVDFEFSAIGAQSTWSEYTFSYTTVASDVGKPLSISIDILDRDLVAGSTQLLTDNWKVISVGGTLPPPTIGILSEGFNIGFIAGDFYTTNGTTFAAHFTSVITSPHGGLTASEGDGFSFLGINNSATNGVATLQGRGAVDLETITAAGQTYTFTGDFAWRFPDAVGVQDDIFMGSGSGFRVDGTIQPASQVDFEFGAIGAQNTWSEYTFSYTTVPADIGKVLTMTIDILDRYNVAGNIQLATDNWKVTIPDNLTIDIEILPSNTNLVISWFSQNGYDYSVEASSNLVAGVWGAVQTNMPGTGGEISYTGTTSAAEVFYRVIAD